MNEAPGDPMAWPSQSLLRIGTEILGEAQELGSPVCQQPCCPVREKPHTPRGPDFDEMDQQNEVNLCRTLKKGQDDSMHCGLLLRGISEYITYKAGFE